MRIQIRLPSATRVRLAAALVIALVVVPYIASAAPHKHAAKPTTASQERFIRECVQERTGPDGGITVKEALKLCTATAKHAAKIAKAKARAAKAIAACRDEVFVSCEDETEREHDGGECSAEALHDELAACSMEGK